FPEARFPDIPSNTYANKLVLQFGGAISGKVTYLADGKPASGIRVKAQKKESGRFTAYVLTDGQGKYTFQDLPVGSYYVGIDSATYTATPHEDVKLESNKTASGIDFKIYRGLTINGEVVDSLSKTGVANATVHLNGEVAGGGKKKLKVTSSRDGSFSFTNLPEGIYFLYAEASGYIIKKSPRDRKKVVLKIGEATPFVVINLYRGGSVSGVVYNKNRQPIDFAYVRAFQPPGARGRVNTKNLQAITSVGGTFKMEGIDVSSAIELVLRASADGYADGISEPILLTPSMPDATTQIVLGEGAAIKGKVLEGSSEGPPVSDVKVTLYNRKFAGDRYYKKPVTWTDGNGNFYFYGVSPGRVSLSAQKYGYVNAGASVKINEGETKEVQIIMQPGMSIAGYVVDDFGRPLEGARVYARPQHGAKGSGSGKTNSMGRFVITKIGKGLYTLNANFSKTTPQGRQSYRRRLRNVPSGTDNAVIVFPINAEITGRVYDSATNEPIEGFSVSGSGKAELDDEGHTTGFSIAYKRYVQTSGEFQCSSLPTGEYTLRFSAPGYVTKTMPKIKITSPEKIDIGTILLSQGGTIEATLFSDTTEEPVSGVSGKLDKGLSRYARSNADGLIRFNNLADGIYNLTLTHRHYITKVIPNITVTAGEVTDLGDIFLEAGATIDGKVKDAEDKPIRGVQITVRSPEKTHKTSTDKFGYYLVDGVKQGNVEVTAQTMVEGQNVMKSKVLDVAPDVHYEVNFIFDYSYTLRGVLDATQFGLSQPKVYIYEINENNEISEARKRVITPGADLSFEAQNLLQGRYFIIATAKPIQTVAPPQVTLSKTRCYALADLTIVHEQNLILYFHAGLVSGEILDQDTGEPVSALSVVLEREPEVRVSTPATLDKFTFSTKTGEDGKFMFFPLPEGYYNLYVESEFIQRLVLGEDQHIIDINIIHQQ
ncbi:carboxypeptidase regulatory-like domain-containing protein, partial [Candidatus Sumerlaeota bacterium]|nr:carboxypeptidase regulatory-like domain-containing protein [Candidatus Sumerlaeota bacterium]